MILIFFLNFFISHKYKPEILLFSSVNPLQDPHINTQTPLVYSVFVTFLMDYSFGWFLSVCETLLFAPDSDTQSLWLVDSS